MFTKKIYGLSATALFAFFKDSIDCSTLVYNLLLVLTNIYFVQRTDVLLLRRDQI